MFMLLTEKSHIEQTLALYRNVLGEDIASSTHFGILDNEILKAAGSVKCYSGHWYLRCCVVKPEYRGYGLQRELIKERLEYLAKKTDVARVSVYPGNNYSLKNIELEGFEFEKEKKLQTGKTVRVYKKELK